MSHFFTYLRTPSQFRALPQFFMTKNDNITNSETITATYGTSMIQQVFDLTLIMNMS